MKKSLIAEDHLHQQHTRALKRNVNQTDRNAAVIYNATHRVHDYLIGKGMPVDLGRAPGNKKRRQNAERCGHPR